MANSVLTPTAVTREVLRVMHNNLVFCRTINRQYDDSHKTNGQRNGGSITIRKPAQYSTTTGAALSLQDHTDQSVVLSIDTTQRHVDMNFTTAELTTDLDDFSRRVITPAASVLASMIDYDAMLMYQEVGNQVGTAGTTPATALTLLNAHKYMNYFACPQSQRYLVVNPDANAALVNGLSGLFNAQSTISKNYQSGMMANNQLGYEQINMSQNVRTHTTGSGAATATTVNDTVATGDSVITLAGSGSETITAGDVFTIANVYSVNPETKQSTGQLMQFVCTATNTASSGAYTDVAFSPTLRSSADARQNVDALPANGATVTIVGSASTGYPINMAYHKDAFAFGTADLEMPKGVHFAAREVLDGISMRLVRQYRIGTDDIPCRIDVLYGYKAVRPEWACRIIG